MDRNDQKKEQQDAASEPTPIYLTSDSTLQTPEEDRKDKSKDPREDNKIEVSNDDLHITHADHLAGTDRAGTAERKDYDEEEEETKGSE